MVKIYEAINAIQAELSKTGIPKSRRNTQQNFDYRGIDDFLETLSPLLAKYKLCVFPISSQDRQVMETQTAKGGVMFKTCVTVKYKFVAEDGSFETVEVIGEAMDSGDKATNKCYSAAYKLAMWQTFTIPASAGDTEEQSHEITGTRPFSKPPRASAPPCPACDSENTMKSIVTTGYFCRACKATFGEE